MANTGKEKNKNTTESETHTHTQTESESESRTHARDDTAVMVHMQEATREGAQPVSRSATYLFGSFGSGGVSVSTSVESVKIKPNCEGEKGGREEDNDDDNEEEVEENDEEVEEDEEGNWLKAPPH